MSYIDETLPTRYYGTVVCLWNITPCGLNEYLILCLCIELPFLLITFNILARTF